MSKVARMFELVEKEGSATDLEGFRVVIQVNENGKNTSIVWDSAEKDRAKEIVKYLQSRGFTIKKGDYVYGKTVNGVYTATLEPNSAVCIDDMSMEKLRSIINNL